MATQKINIGGREFIYDGRGYVPAPPAPYQESDPVFQQEKNQFVKKSEMPPEIVTKSDLPPLTEIAIKSDVPSIANLVVKPDYTDVYYRSEVVYENDLIKLKIIGTNSIYNVVRLTVRTSWGDKIIDPKMVYNGGWAYLYSEFLSQNANWEFFILEYSIVSNTRTYIPDLRGRIGRNVLINEPSTDYHGEAMKHTFDSVHSLYSPIFRQSIDVSQPYNGSSIDELAVEKKFNIMGYAFARGSGAIETSSAPDILPVSGHYSNDDERRDITPDANTFKNNTIAVSAGENLDGTGTWTSYGFGVEFFEAFQDFQTFYNTAHFQTFYTALFSMTVDPDLRTIRAADTHKVNTSGRIDSINERYIGETLWVHYGEEKIEYKVAQIIDDYTLIADRDIVITGTPYTHGYFSYLASIQPEKPQQSCTCYIVVAKLAAIQDLTNASWQLIREAARMTASNSTMQVVNGKKVYTPNWDMKRGFGIIDVDKAVEYIEDNYINNQEYIDSVIPQLPKINPLLKLEHLEDTNPVTKKMLMEAPEKELKANKQNSLAVDGTGTKYPTVDAVNAKIGAMSGELIVDYTHTSNKEVHISSIDYATNTFTSVGHGLSNSVSYLTTLMLAINRNELIYPYNVMPFANLTGYLPYQGFWVINATPDTFQLSFTEGGSAIVLLNKPETDLTKWHFEYNTATTIQITGLLGKINRGCRAVIDGSFCRFGASYIGCQAYGKTYYKGISGAVQEASYSNWNNSEIPVPSFGGVVVHTDYYTPSGHRKLLDVAMYSYTPTLNRIAFLQKVQNNISPVSIPDASKTTFSMEAGAMITNGTNIKLYSI